MVLTRVHLYVENNHLVLRRTGDNALVATHKHQFKDATQATLWVEQVFRPAVKACADAITLKTSAWTKTRAVNTQAYGLASKQIVWA